MSWILPPGSSHAYAARISLSRILTAPERFPGRTIAAVGTLLAVAYTASLFLITRPTERLVVGDALHYYVYLRSAVFDRDLQFRNDYQHLLTGKRGDDGAAWIHEQTATGHVSNVMSVGPAIVWAPLFLVTTVVVSVTRAAGIAYPLDGYAPAFQLSAFYSGIAAATLGAWFSFRGTATLFGVRPAIWATLTIWLGSSAIYYSLISPAYSHAASMLATSAFFWLWLATQDRQTIGRYFVLGLAGGCMALVRWQDAVFLIAPALEAAWSMRTVGHPARFRVALLRCLALGAGAILGFVPQGVAWMILFGHPFAVPQGSGFMRWASPRVVEVLFSDRHGLFSWTPVTLPAVCGLVLIWRRYLIVAAGCLAAFAAAVYVNAAVWDWWAGEAFGARRFVSCFPIFVIGLAAVLARWRARESLPIAVAGGFIGLNLLLLLQYQAFMRSLMDNVPYPDGWYGMTAARFVVAWRLIRALAGV